MLINVIETRLIKVIETSYFHMPIIYLLTTFLYEMIFTFNQRTVILSVVVGYSSYRTKNKCFLARVTFNLLEPKAFVNGD